MERLDPNAAHHLLMRDLDGLMTLYESMPVLQRVAVLAQLLGQLTREVPSDLDPQEVLRAIAMNIAAGNGTSARHIAGGMAQ